MTAPTPARGGFISLSWGKWGGFYKTRYHATRLGAFPYFRVCVGWVALTYMGTDLDQILQWAAEEKK